MSEASVFDELLCSSLFSYTATLNPMLLVEVSAVFELRAATR